MYYNENEGGGKMQEELLLKDEKRKISAIMKKEYVTLKFSELHLILDNNYNEPRWMNTYILLYKASLPKNIVAYDILLEKLSASLLKFYFKKEDGKRYIVSADEKIFREYVWYLTTKEDKEYTFLAQYLPSKEYIKEVLRFSKYRKCGLVLENVKEDEFILNPVGYRFKTPEEARLIYEKLFDAYDLFVNLKLDKNNFMKNFYACLKLGKDKRMIAILSTMISYFNCQFVIQNDAIGIAGTELMIQDEQSAKAFESHMMDVYHFFRNVINTKNKRDIVSEVCNKKVSKEIMEEFTANLAEYSNLVTNHKGLVDWIITISRESKYTLNIKCNEKGVFFIDNVRIATEQEAEFYYIEYMEKKSEHLSLVEYKSSILMKVKKFFSFIKMKFGKKINLGIYK